MSQVISLAAYRARQQDAVVAPAPVSLDIDFTDVTRVYPHREDGSPLLSLDNTVLLGARARAQVQALFWHYGLCQMPRTWGELEGNWNYCRLLGMWSIAMAADEPPAILKGLRVRHNQREPGRGDLLWLLMTGDLDGAYAWHREHDTVRRNARDPSLTPDKAAAACGEAT